MTCTCAPDDERAGRYCRIHGEHTGRMVESEERDKLAAIMPAMSRLNSWCRLPYEQQLDMSSLVPQIYSWKRQTIAAAMRLGVASLRIVAIPRSCKTCSGTGEFKRWDRDGEDYWEGETCRRCMGTGKVVLKFVESEMLGCRWHSPRPRWDLGHFTTHDWEDAKPGDNDWAPEQPGAPLERLELIRLVNTVERIALEGQKLRADGTYRTYSLHLGIEPGCWICGSGDCRYDWDIWRPIGLRWKSKICKQCDLTDAWREIQPTWPMTLHQLREHDNYPQWHDRVQLPLIAHSEEVMRWLARREIFIGQYPAGDFAYTCNGDFVRVLSASRGSYEVQIEDHHYGYEGAFDGMQIRVNELRPTARNPYLPTDPFAEVGV